MKSSILLLTCFLFAHANAEPDKITTKILDNPGWVDLLEKDKSLINLKYWRTVSCPPSTFKLTTDKKGVPMISCTGKPFGLLRSADVYENFIFECEWRHMTKDGMKANAGIFVWSDALPEVCNPFSRAIEIQVANFARNAKWFTRHGDIFAIQGAKLTPDPRFASLKGGQRSLPIEYRANGTAEWNHYRITCINGVIQLEVNGRLVSAGYHASPRKGHIILESEGGEVHFRNIKVLPLKGSGDLKPEMIAKTLDKNTTITPIYTGIDLNNWDTKNLSLKNGFTAQGHLLQAKANSGHINTKLQPKNDNYTLHVDFSCKQPLMTLPVELSFLQQLENIAIPKGIHRFTLISKTEQGEVTKQLLLDGKPLIVNPSQFLPRANEKKDPALILHSDLKNNITFMNILIIE